MFHLQVIVIPIHIIVLFLTVGGGFYVSASNYISSTAVANNSLIVSGSSYYCQGCSVNIHCYSNSTLSNVGYMVFPGGGRTYSTGSYGIYINRQQPAGISTENRRYDYPHYYGIYTCEIPDSTGHQLNYSIAIYFIMPSM